MIGLTALAVLGFWVFIVLKISKILTKFIKAEKIKKFAVPLVFMLVFCAPVSDEIVGRLQFYRLCATEAKVWVAPNASEIVAARRKDTAMIQRSGFVFPIREQSGIYLDVETGKPFYTFKAFHTPGGFLMRNGLGLGNSSSCWPEKWSSQANNIDIDAMIKRGKGDITK